ncbi:nitrate reductase [Aureimonas endophytica]|uniref:Nitrate reductase n=1 Tax=Aureimonas endophytica TaxID=2027858 RepID=A0A916ZHL5_9HYPH|nr:nitrate reductase [Aureimonas endophytica]GGD96607.1 nitrate reductase [Aureimonas endophytica]
MSVEPVLGGTVKTTCPYCGTGCGVLATPRPDGTVAIAGDPDHPANFGRLCSKGAALGETLGLADRLVHPRIGGARASWDEALDLVARRFSETIAAHGPDSVAFYVSGQLLTEDYYIANKLMKGFIGSGNIDTNSRLCMSSSVAGHVRAFGADTVPGTYEDLEHADLVVLVGSNLAWCHPVLYQRIAAAKAARPDLRIVLIDPRRTATADLADLHLALAPDADAALFSGLLAFLDEAGVVNTDYVARHTEGFAAALDAARAWTLPRLARRTGLAADQILSFFRLFAVREKVVTVYSQGVNQSVCGTDKVNAILNCHLATGRIGREGMGPFSVTGQPNAMGGREVGGLANMLAAHLRLEDAAHRDLAQGFWQSPAIAAKPGLKAVDLFRAVGAGRIKALWIMGTNPVVSMPEADGVADALRRCPFVAVSDIMARTDTLDLAHVALPAAGWGEKDGTVTNSERRISRQRPFLARPGEARPDWWIIAEVARRMGFGEAFAYEGPADIFDEHARLSAAGNAGSRDFDLSGLVGLDPAGYESLAPVQWPVTQAGGRTRFFAEGGFFHPGGKARFVVPEGEQTSATGLISPSARGEIDRSERHLLLTVRLNSGRVRDHWHTMTRTGLSARLSGHIAEPYAEIHPEDAARAGLREAEIVRLRSPHGEVLLRCLMTDRVRPGEIFAPMHWNGPFASKARIDALVEARVDPVSGQPALKGSRVSIARYPAAWYGFAVLRERPATIPAAYHALARTEGGWRVELADADGLDPIELARALFDGAGDHDLSECRDRTGGTQGFAAFEGKRLRGALWLGAAPVAVSRLWASLQLASERHDALARWRLLAGRGGADRPDPGAIVCSCFKVGAKDIARAIAGGCDSVAAVGAATKAGTNCGSCRSEIKGIIDGQSLRQIA